jgi:hypothetical protein
MVPAAITPWVPHEILLAIQGIDEHHAASHGD